MKSFSCRGLRAGRLQRHARSARRSHRQTDSRRPSLLSVRQKRTWNSRTEKWWGSGVTHSAHALKPPTWTHLGQIMGHAVTACIPSCHCCGLKSPANNIRDLPLLCLLLPLRVNSVHKKRCFLFPLIWFRRNRSIWRTEEDVFTHVWCSFTLEYIHPATSVWLCVHRCLCLPEEN